MPDVLARIRAWMQLIRPPNLFTVPGDPLAGFVVACVAVGCVPDLRLAVLPALTALCLYVGGLIGNDVADETEDWRDRPDRPIPSGHVTRSQAMTASAVCVVVGFWLAWMAGINTFVAAVFTQAAICAYNGGLKRYPIVGALAMGACRGGSVLLGATAAGWLGASHVAAFVVAIGIALYIAAVTAIADRETEEVRLGMRRGLPLVVLAGLWCAVGVLLRTRLHTEQVLLFLLLGATAMAWAGLQATRLRDVPPPPVVGRSVGALIRGLLLVQAGFCVFAGVPGLVAAMCLLACWPLSAAMAGRFYAS